MKGIFRFFAERSMMANLFTFSVLLLGVGSLMTIKRDQYPSVDMGQMVISTVYPGASPEDVEINVTYKLEDELKKVTEIKHFTSVSAENISTIIVEIDYNAQDMAAVKDDIRRAVDQVTDFPAAVTERPFIIDIKTPFDPFIEVGLVGDIPYEKLREEARLIEKKLTNLPGVHRVERFGYRYREVSVALDPVALERYQIPIREVMMAIQGRNVRGAGGSMESYTSEKNVVTLAQFRSPEEVGEVIVRSSFDGPSVKISDLAQIQDGFEEESQISTINGKRAISFAVFLKPSADVIRTVEGVEKLVEKERTAAPEGVSFVIANDTSKGVKNQFSIVINNGAIGLTLVMAILTILLNFRTAFWVAIGIPVAFFGVVFLLPTFGAYLDTIVLTALVIVLGIIVDDAIIVSESIYRRLEMGDSPIDAAVNGLHKVYRPVITTMLTTFMAFAPMFFMPGMMGLFVYVIPLSVTLALTISLAEIIIALPAHLIHAERKVEGKRPEADVVADRGSVWFHRLEDRFAAWVVKPFRYRYVTVAVFTLVFMGTLVYAKQYMHVILFPSKGADRFLIGVELPIGSSLEATADVMAKLDKILATLPEEELESFVGRVGMRLKMGAPPTRGERFGAFIVNLTHSSKRERIADELVAHMRAEMEKIPEIEKLFFHVITNGPPTGDPVTIRMVGSDDTLRKRLADDVVAYLEKMEGVSDLERDDLPGKEQVEIKIDYEKLARLGLTVAEIAQNVRVAYDGEVVTTVRFDEEELEYRVIMNEAVRKRLDYLEKLTIPNNRGRLIRLGEVATFEVSPGPSDIYHFNRERTTTITGQVNMDITTPLQATDAVAARFDLDKDYPGMRFQIGGEAQETDESMKGLMMVFVFALIGIYFLLILLFNSFAQPLIVMAAIPFGIAGVIIAFAVHGETFGFLAMLGIVGMAGVVVNDSLVLVDHLNNKKRAQKGEPLLEMVARGSADRLRAILMTSATTVAGLLPLAYGIGGTDIYMGPMALALGYGIFFATPLTLVLVPSLYLIGQDLHGLKQKVFGGRG